jgi:hypothetical protein
MPYGERVFNPAGDRAEGDKLFEQSVFYGTSGTLSIGMPVFKDLTDAAEFNTKIAATAQTNTANTSLVVGGNIIRTGGRVVLGTNANTNINGIVGIYAPENPADLPNQGDPIRILVYGEGIVRAISQSGNTNAITVGSMLVASTAVVPAIAAGNTPVVRQTLGIVLATGAVYTVGATLTGGGVAANVAILVNAFVNPG